MSNSPLFQEVLNNLKNNGASTQEIEDVTTALQDNIEKINKDREECNSKPGYNFNEGTLTCDKLFEKPKDQTETEGETVVLGEIPKNIKTSQSSEVKDFKESLEPYQDYYNSTVKELTTYNSIYQEQYPSFFVSNGYFGFPELDSPSDFRTYTDANGNETKQYAEDFIPDFAFKRKNEMSGWEDFLREDLNFKLGALGVEVDDKSFIEDEGQYFNLDARRPIIILKSGWDSEKGEWTNVLELDIGGLQKGRDFDKLSASGKMNFSDNKLKVRLLNDFIAKTIKYKKENDPQFDLDMYHAGVQRTMELYPKGYYDKGLKNKSPEELLTERNDIVFNSIEDYFKTEDGKELQLSLLDEINVAADEEFLNVMDEFVSAGNFDPGEMKDEFMKRLDDIIIKTYNNNEQYRKLLYNISLSNAGMFEDVLQNAIAKQNISKELGEWFSGDNWFQGFALGLVKGFKYKLPQEIQVFRLGIQTQKYKNFQNVISDTEIGGIKDFVNLDGQGEEIRSASVITNAGGTTSDYKNFMTQLYEVLPKNYKEHQSGFLDFFKFSDQYTAKSWREGTNEITKYRITDDQINWMKSKNMYLKSVGSIKNKDGSVIYLGLYRTAGSGSDPNVFEVIPLSAENLEDLDFYDKKKKAIENGAIFDPVSGKMLRTKGPGDKGDTDGSFMPFLVDGFPKSFTEEIYARSLSKQFDKMLEIIDDQATLDGMTSNEEKHFSEGSLTITAQNWGQAVGDGVFRASLAIFSVGFGSVLTESANAYQQYLFGLAQSDHGDKWNSYSDEEKVEILLATLEQDHEKCFQAALKVGAINGVLETIGSFTIIGKVGKGLKKNANDYIRLWFQLNIKQALRQTYRAGIRMTAAGITEALTEVLQELTTEIGTPGNDFKISSIASIDNWDDYKNAAVTAFITAISLTGGGSIGVSVKNKIKEDIAGIKTPQGIVKYAKARKDQLGKELKEGNITEQEYEETMELIASAERIFYQFNQVFRDASQVEILYEKELQAQKDIKIKKELEKKRDEIQADIQKLNPGITQDELMQNSDLANTVAELKTFEEKIREARQEQVKAAFVDNYKSGAAEIISNINTNFSDKYFARSTKTADQALNILQEKFGVDINNEIFKNFKDGKANGLILSTEDMQSLVPGYEGPSIVLFAEDNIAKNIDAGSINSTNVVVHELEHVLMMEKFTNGPQDTKGDEKLQGFVNKLKEGLANAKNKELLGIYLNITNFLENTPPYSNLKPGSRIYNEEFMCRFGDLCKAYQIYAKLGYVPNTDFIVEMTKLGKAFWSEIHDKNPYQEGNWNFKNIIDFMSLMSKSFGKDVDITEENVALVVDEDGKNPTPTIVREQMSDDYAMYNSVVNSMYPNRASLSKVKNEDGFSPLDNAVSQRNQELADLIIAAEKSDNPLIRKAALKHRQELIFNNWSAFMNVVNKAYDKKHPLHTDVNFDQFRGLALEQFITAALKQYDPNVNNNFFVYFFKKIQPNGKTIAESRIPDIWDKIQKQFSTPIDPTPDTPGLTPTELQTTQETEINIIQQIEDFNERSALRESLQDIFNFKIGDKNYNDFLALVKDKYMDVDFSDLTDQQIRDMGKDLWKNFRDIGQEGGKFFKNGEFTPLYINFIEGSAKTLFQQMSVKDLVKFLGEDKDLFLDLETERATVEKSLNIKGKDQPKNKYAGNQIRTKKKLTPELEQLLIDKLLNRNQFEGSKRFDALIQATLKNYASVLFNDATMQTVTDDSFIEENGINNSQISQISKMLNKGIDVKFQIADKGTSIIKLDELNPKYFDRDGSFNSKKYNDDMNKFFEKADDFAKTLNLEEDYDLIMNKIEELGEKAGFDNGSIGFMQRLFDLGYPQDADGTNFQSAVTNNPNIPDNVKTRREAIRYNTEGKNAMFENALIMTKIFGREFMEVVGYEFLGFKNSSRTLHIGKDGAEFTDRFNDLVANIPESKLTEELKQALKDFRAMNLNNGSAQNFTNSTTGKDKNVFGRLKVILEDASLTREQKLKRINDSGLAAEIEAANKANIVIFEFIATMFMEQAVAGNIDEKAMLEMFKMSSGTVFGFRSFSQLIGFQCIDGAQVVDKGEHVGAISTINSAIVDLIFRYKKNKGIDFKGELRSILAEYGQVLGNKKHFNILDKYKRTNNTNTYRLTILNRLLNYTNAKGDNIKKIQNDVLLNKEKIKLESYNKKKGEVLTNLRNQVADGSFNSATVLDFDDTVMSPNNVVYATLGGKTIKVPAKDFVKRAKELTDKGYTFDFKDFINVRGNKKGPYFERMFKQIEKHGPDSFFILTARQPEAAVAIHGWLKSNGVNIPLENIIGLGKDPNVVVTGEMKAKWIEENLFFNGIDDLEFADDSPKNVEAVKKLLEDYKDYISRRSKSVLVEEDIRYQLSDLEWVINDKDGTVDAKRTMDAIIEEDTGIKAYKNYTEAEGKIIGAKYKSLWNMFLPSSTYDLELFFYKLLAKGKRGEQQLEFFKQNLQVPFEKAMQDINAEKQRLDDNVNLIIKELGKVKHGNLKKLVEGTNFSFEQAVRVYLWAKNGIEIPGLAATTQKKLVDAVLADADIQAFADKLGILSRSKDGYVQPTEYWTVENIATDLRSLTTGASRASYLQIWKQNVEKVFSPEIKNKLRAAYGNAYVDNLESMLYRMEFGTKRKEQGRIETAWSNWVNNSVGAIMFFNMRSATLQLVSAFNYIDFQDNNIINAGKRVLDVKQFVKDFSFIFNSDYLRQRRGGETRGVNEAELAKAIEGADNPMKAIVAYLLKIGFAPTRIADSIAISSGGSVYYRNKVIAYEKKGFSKKEAESMAFQDFITTTEKSQQSYRPDLISEQQASNLGRLVQAFANTPQQYFRIMNKSIQDLAAGRGDAKSNLAKIAYYGAVQNAVFVTLQQAVFSKFGEDEDEWDETKKRAVNSMIDNLLTGMGFSGQILRTAKNSFMEWSEQTKRGYNADHAYTLIQFANLSPTIGSKLRKLYSGIKGEQINRQAIERMGFTIHNPAFNAMAQLISAVTNVPVDRAVQKIQNLLLASKDDVEFKDKLALFLGWNPWDLNLTTEVQKVRDEIKDEKKKIKEETKEAEAVNEIQDDVNEEIKKQKEQEDKGEEVTPVKCAYVNSSNQRCGMTVDKAGDKCKYHTDDKTRIKQCTGIKSDGKRCKNTTTNKSGRCEYHPK